MRVLVAGGLGFLGSHLVDRLLQRPDLTSCTVVDNLWTGLASNLDHVTDPRLKIVIGDVETAPLDGLFDEIYHLASPATPLGYMTEPLRTVSANVVGALRLLKVLQPGGQIAYTSTSEVYGEPLVSPQPESYRGSVDCTGPRASYDESKRCVETILFEAHRVMGVRVKVVRLFNVYGPRTRMDDGRAVSNFVTQAIRGLPITIYGDGSQGRSWGYVDDIMDALSRYWWLDRCDYCGPLNIGNTREITVAEVARFVQRQFPKSTIVHLPPVPDDPTHRCPDLTLASQVIPGWSCSIPYEVGVEQTIRWFMDTMAVPAAEPRSFAQNLGDGGATEVWEPARRRRSPRVAGLGVVQGPPGA